MPTTPTSYGEVADYCRYFGNRIFVRYQSPETGKWESIPLYEIKYGDALVFINHWWEGRVFPSIEGGSR